MTSSRVSADAIRHLAAGQQESRGPAAGINQTVDLRRSPSPQTRLYASCAGHRTLAHAGLQDMDDPTDHPAIIDAALRAACSEAAVTKGKIALLLVKNSDLPSLNRWGAESQSLTQGNPLYRSQA